MPSGFGDKKHLSRDDFRQWLRKPELFNTTGMNEAERLEYEEELRSVYGSYLEPSEIDRVKKSLEMEITKEMDGKKRSKIGKKLKLIKQFLGQ
ncbi:MAG: hypothetical protein ABIA08_00840 [bacterium]